MNDEGKILQVNLKDSTLQDSEIEGCFRAVIGAMKIPEEALELRSSGPVSGGERRRREQRAPMASESESPRIFLGPMIVEAVGIEVIIQVGVGIIAAVATLVDTTEKNPKDRCRDHYVSCMDTPLGSMRMGEKKGASRCEWCRKKCQDNGGDWPLTVDAAVGQRSCKYW